MNQPGLQVAGVAKVHRRKLFAALVQGEKLEVGGGVVQPGHAFGRGPPGSRRHNHLEPAKVPPSVSVTAAMIQPENPQRQNAGRGGRRLRLADADHRVGSGAAQQPPAHIGRPKAVLQVHRRAQSVHLGADEARASARAPAAAGSFSAPHRGQWACGGRSPRRIPASAAWPRPCGGWSGAGIARAPANPPPCASGCARRSTTATGSGHAARSRRSGRCACRRGRGHPQAARLPGGPLGTLRCFAPAVRGMRRRACTGGHAERLPALPRAQAGDVRGVVARVPVVHRQRLGQVLAAILGMVVALLEVLVGERFQQRHPARVQRPRSSPAKHRRAASGCQPAWPRRLHRRISRWANPR